MNIMRVCFLILKCLVIHNNAKSNKLADQVFWYKAESHEDFRIGSKAFWDYSANEMLQEGGGGGGGDNEFSSQKKDSYVVSKTY